MDLHPPSPRRRDGFVGLWSQTTGRSSRRPMLLVALVSPPVRNAVPCAANSSVSQRPWRSTISQRPSARRAASLTIVARVTQRGGGAREVDECRGAVDQRSEDRRPADHVDESRRVADRERQRLTPDGRGDGRNENARPNENARRVGLDRREIVATAALEDGFEIPRTRLAPSVGESVPVRDGGDVRGHLQRRTRHEEASPS